MHPHTRLLRVSLAVVACALPLALGCGSAATTPVKGKLVLPQGYTLKQTDSVSIAFSPEGKGQGATATVNTQDSTFTATAGGTAKGVAPGKYKVTVKVTPYAGEPGSAGRAAQFEQLNRKFDQAASPLTYEVTPGAENNITIDLGKSSVTKN